MNWDDEDNSWIDALVSEVPAAPARSTRSAGKMNSQAWCMSPEFCQKVSQGIQKHWQLNPDKRQRMSQVHSGKIVSESVRQRISETKKARMALRKGFTGHTGASKPIQTPNGVFPSRKAAAQYMVDHGQVSTVGYGCNTITHKIKIYPDQYYYIKKETL